MKQLGLWFVFLLVFSMQLTAEIEKPIPAPQPVGEVRKQSLLPSIRLVRVTEHGDVGELIVRCVPINKLLSQECILRRMDHGVEIGSALFAPHKIKPLIENFFKLVPPEEIQKIVRLDKSKVDKSGSAIIWKVSLGTKAAVGALSRSAFEIGDPFKDTRYQAYYALENQLLRLFSQRAGSSSK